MVKIRITLSSIVFLFSLYFANGQDIILKLNSDFKPIYCDDISIQNTIISFKDIISGKNHEYPLNEISKINFYHNQPNEIFIPRLQLDTITCMVDSITETSIYFSIGDNQQQTVDKESVFCILFNGMGDKSFDLFRARFFQLNAPVYSSKHKIIKMDGTLVDVRNLISLTQERIEFNLFINGVERTTYIDTKEVTSFINKEPIGKLKMNLSSDFILSNDDRYIEGLIKKVDKETIECIVNSSLNTRIQKFDKNKVIGVFFYDYKSKVIIPSSKIIYTNKYRERTFRKVRVDLNAGIGKMLANAPNNSSEEEIKFIDDLRLGYTLDMNLNCFLIKEFGIGLKFNQFTTSNSITNPLNYSNEIQIRFFGFSLLSQLGLINNRIFLNSGISLGRLLEANQVKENLSNYKVEGNTFGTYIFTGLDFFIEDYISIGIKCGLMHGKIDKLKVDGKDIEMQGEENLSRFDGLVNFMIYF